MENIVIPIQSRVRQPYRYKTKVIKYIISVISIIAIVVSGVFAYKAYQDYKIDKAINNLFVINSYSNKEEIISIAKRIKKLPAKVQDTLLNNKIKIDYETWVINEIPNYKDLYTFDVAGVFDGAGSRIVLQYEPNVGKELIERNILNVNTFHEIGHAFDYDYVLKQYGYSYSGGMEFYNIFKEEASKIFSVSNFNYLRKDFGEYFIKDRMEYFAECFGFYFASDDTNKFLKENAPKTYSYIKQITK